jgi:hypothetical protein
MKRMIRQLFLFIAIFSQPYLTLFGQINKTTTFDSTKYFVKGIYFVLLDSTAKKDTLYKDIKYIQETTTTWNYEKDKWETKSHFATKIVQFYPRKSVSKIDSFYFYESYSIEEPVLHVSCPGTTLEIIGGFDGIKSGLKKYGRREDCKLALSMTVVNKEMQRQELFLILN